MSATRSNQGEALHRTNLGAELFNPGYKPNEALPMVEKHFPGYDFFMQDSVHEVSGRAIRSLVEHGFWHTEEEFIFTRTGKPPQIAYSVLGNEVVKYLKRLAQDRKMLRQSLSGAEVEVVNTAYDKGPTAEQYRFLDRLDPRERPHKLTDADFMNPSSELLALVEAHSERHRLIKEKRAPELLEAERRHGLIKRHKESYLAGNNTWSPARPKVLANRALSLPTYVRQH